jgi:hypothetical protein
VKTLVKHTVHQVRSVIYFPVNFLISIRAPLPFVLAVSSFIVKVDAPLRRYLVGGHHAI